MNVLTYGQLPMHQDLSTIYQSFFLHYFFSDENKIHTQLFTEAALKYKCTAVKLIKAQCVH